MGGRATRALRWLASPLTAVLALPALIPAAVLFAAHTEAGRELIASAVYELSGGQVALHGLTGVLPHGPRVARLELRDPEGAWLRAEDVALDLDLGALFRREIDINSLSARSMTLLRLPTPSGASSGQIQPPWPTRVGRLQVAELSLDAVAPRVPVLAVQVSGSSHGAGDTWEIAAARIDTGGGSLQVQGSVSGKSLALSATLDVPDLGVLIPGAAGPFRVSGGVTGSPARPELAVQLEELGLTLPGDVRVAAIRVDARVSDLFGAIDVDGSARLTGLSDGTVAGDAAVTARGPVRALVLNVHADLQAWGEPARVDLGGRLDAFGRVLAVERLEAAVRDEALRLIAPATLDFSDGIAVDRLRLGLRRGAIEISGRLAPVLAVDATVRDVPVDLFRTFGSSLPLSGTIGAEGRLTGPYDAVGGQLRARADGLRLTEGPGRGLPPASVQVTATLGATGVDVEAGGEAGKGARFGLRGRVGVGTPAGLGTLDLRADGRAARGKAELDARIAGTFAALRLDGGLRISNGSLWDRPLGLALTDLQGRLALAGETLRVEQLTARAGSGTVVLDGTVGLLAPGVPVDLHLGARDARPFQRDELDLQGSGDVRLTGAATERLRLAGAVRLDAVAIRLPERLPAAIANLEVRERGRRRAEPPGARGGSPRRLDLDLDLAVSAPRKVEVRGRGIDAELGGEVRLQGPLTGLVATGGFELIRGQFTLVGQPLRFSRGRIGFDGAAVLDPTLDLEARTSAGGGTAILAVSGTVGTPRVELRGEPEMPQDEVLSRLLFGVAGGRLSPWQATRLGLAAASLAGTRAPAAGALTRVGRGLGLDRLGLVADEQGEAAIEGGRDLGDRAYLGARQSSRTGEPQGVLRFEASPRVQIEADVGPVGGTRAGVVFEHEF